MTRRKPLKTLVFLALLALLIPACASDPQEAARQIAEIRAIKAQIDEQVQGLLGEADALNQTLAETRAELEKLPQGSELREDLLIAAGQAQAALDRVERVKSTLLERSAALDDRLAQIQAQGDSGLGAGLQVGGAVAKELGPILPPPIGEIAAALGVLLTGVGGAVARIEKRKREQAEQIAGDLVRSIEAAKTDGKVDFTDPETRRRLEALQSPEAKKFVDQVQGKPA